MSTIGTIGLHKLSPRLLFVFMFFLVSVHASAQNISVVDDEDTVVTLSEPATRIISLAPALTELLFSIDAGNRIEGVVEFSDFPPAALTIPIIGRHDRLDMERIIEIDPDLILAWVTGNPRGSVARLKEMGYTVFMAETQALEDIPSLIEKLGRLTAEDNKAQDVANDFRNQYQSLQSVYGSRPILSTFYQIWNAPLISVGGDELINDIIELCGGRNIFADIQQKAPKVSEEAVLNRNPEIIVASGADDQRPAWLDDWKEWNGLTAVAQESLFFVPPDLVMRPTLRALQGAEMLCEQIDSAR
ncbi:MAG: cobalamin-binding protein [Gammaproteobacteria bacterium]|nr:cobalamin-binding protein [Gammaproteobacteria bacterium]MBT3859316.1 cobalamin-binding protein [Gammaproteobacteria bacterium]MBT3988006.1 cobalamin-binding protein [Gammaproteobacteria bacterium]MBT4255379.1 cobalamin-binding protein [Gammaproteobacteria bacterium]MBT4583095.1 cobalamin-binding protein [Gammaproteobacteria bacterium]